MNVRRDKYLDAEKTPNKCVRLDEIQHKHDYRGCEFWGRRDLSAFAILLLRLGAGLFVCAKVAVNCGTTPAQYPQDFDPISPDCRPIKGRIDFGGTRYVPN